jgi:hypothetical protein
VIALVQVAGFLTVYTGIMVCHSLQDITHAEGFIREDFEPVLRQRTQVRLAFDIGISALCAMCFGVTPMLVAMAVLDVVVRVGMYLFGCLSHEGAVEQSSCG